MILQLSCKYNFFFTVFFFCSTKESRTSAVHERWSFRLCATRSNLFYYSILEVVICNHSNWSVRIDAVLWTQFLVAYTVCNLGRWTLSNLTLYKPTRETSNNDYYWAVDGSTSTLVRFNPAIRQFIQRIFWTAMVFWAHYSLFIWVLGGWPIGSLG